jgi:hypothetical protein
MEHRDGALEALLQRGAAGILEVDLAELVVRLRLDETRGDEQQRNERYRDGPVQIHRPSCRFVDIRPRPTIVVLGAREIMGEMRDFSRRVVLP